MSRHPSPGPSHPPPHSHIFQPVSTPSTRQKSRAYATGIAAGAEDVKYQAKYKELKRKVKEIEADNDKLHFKTLQAKRNIQRMKLERAILYERLSAVPPSPDIHDRHGLPPIHLGPGVPPHQQSSLGHPGPHNHPNREHVQGIDPNDPALLEYLRSHGNGRVIAGPDGRIAPMADAPMGPGVAPSSHGMATAHPSRRGSGSGHDLSRQLPPLSQLAPIPVQHLDGVRGPGHSHPQSHTSPHMHPHAPPSASHSRSRSSGSRSRAHQPPAQSFHPTPPGHSHGPQFPPDTLPPVQHVTHSPSLSAERSRLRRHDIHELAGPQVDNHAHSRQQMPSQTSPPQQHQHPDERSSNRIHHHQRIGPAANISHAENRERDLEREREWEREREMVMREREAARRHSPPAGHRSQSHLERVLEHQDHGLPSRGREEQAYYHDREHPLLSRSGTPGSGSGSGSGNGAPGDGVSRPDSRTQRYEHGRPGSYSSRVAHQPGAHDGVDFVHEDGRTLSRATPGQTRASSKKRPWDDMDVDEERDVENSPATAERAEGGNSLGGYTHEDRGSKRRHPDRASTTPARGADSQEDTINAD